MKRSQKMDADFAFDEYCNWHGLMSWGPVFRKTLDDINQASEAGNVNVNELPEHILSALRNREHSDEGIEAMSAEEAFDEFCEWNAIIGWGPSLRSTLISLKSAEVSDTQ